MKLALPARLERATIRLTAERSTIELEENEIGSGVRTRTETRSVRSSRAAYCRRLLHGYYFFFPRCLLRNSATTSETFIRFSPDSDYTTPEYKMALGDGIEPP